MRSRICSRFKEEDERLPLWYQYTGGFAAIAEIPIVSALTWRHVYTIATGRLSHPMCPYFISYSSVHTFAWQQMAV